MIGLVSLALNPTAWVVMAVVALGAWHAGFNAVPREDIIAARDAHWANEIRLENEINEKRIADAIEAGQSVTIPADLVSLCDRDAACRDKGGQRQ